MGASCTTDVTEYVEAKVTKTIKYSEAVVGGNPKAAVGGNPEVVAEAVGETSPTVVEIPLAVVETSHAVGETSHAVGETSHAVGETSPNENNLYSDLIKLIKQSKDSPVIIQFLLFLYFS